MMQHFDKILLVVLFTVVFGVTTWLTSMGTMDEGSLDWGRQTGGTIIGALLGLITGQMIKGKE